MAWTITRAARYNGSTNSHITKIGLLTGPNPYTVGGEALVPNTLGMGQIDILLIEPLTNGTVILLALYDPVNQEIKVFDMAGAESGAIDLSTYTARFIAFGV